jgi:acyl carrier protein
MALNPKVIIMENKAIRRNLYRVLRKTGVQKKDILLNASFTEDLRFDNTDWSVFTFYLENIFKIDLKDEEIKKMHCIKDTIAMIKKTA